MLRKKVKTTKCFRLSEEVIELIENSTIKYETTQGNFIEAVMNYLVETNAINDLENFLKNEKIKEFIKINIKGN
jgi:hypothetical protein